MCFYYFSGIKGHVGAFKGKWASRRGGKEWVYTNATALLIIFLMFRYYSAAFLYLKKAVTTGMSGFEMFY